MEDMNEEILCLQHGFDWYKNIRHVREIIEKKKPIDVNFEIRDAKRVLLSMIYDLGVMSTCGLSSQVAEVKLDSLIFAIDYLDAKNFMALKAELNKLETF